MDALLGWWTIKLLNFEAWMIAIARCLSVLVQTFIFHGLPSLLVLELASYMQGCILWWSGWPTWGLFMKTNSGGDKLILQVDKKCWFPGVVSTTPWMQWLYMLEEVSIDMIYKIICHPCLPILMLNIGVWWSAKMEMIMATPGLWGLLCVPFFMSVNLPVGERGILFDGGIS